LIQGQAESADVDRTQAARRTTRRAGQRKQEQVLQAAGRVIADRGAEATRFAVWATPTVGMPRLRQVNRMGEPTTMRSVRVSTERNGVGQWLN
jgi:hypothetical protein